MILHPVILAIFPKQSCGLFARLFACTLLFALPWLSLPAQDAASAAQKKYKKEITALFGNLEITESALQSNSLAVGDLLAPTFKLRNKSGNELVVPFALGYPSDRGGVIGFPVWRFEKANAGAKKVVFRKGVLAYAFKLEPGGVMQVDGSSVKGMSLDDLGLGPGEYKMTVNFYPFVSVGGEGLSSRPFKFVVVGDASSPGAQPMKQGASKAAARLPAAPSLLPYVTLGKVEFASDAVKSGAPLNCTFDIKVDPGRPLPVVDPSVPSSRLNCSWTLFKLGSQKASKDPVRIAGSIINVKADGMDALHANGSCTLRLLNETVGLGQGNYQIMVALWEETSDGRRINGNSASGDFKIVK
ncbi:MAG: hypothetical protein ACKOBS_01810 [Verrucomicrobiota bacterium]